MGCMLFRSKKYKDGKHFISCCNLEIGDFDKKFQGSGGGGILSDGGCEKHEYKLLFWVS